MVPANTAEPTGFIKLLETILSSTSNDIIVFVIVLAIIGVICGIPLYRMKLKKQKQEDTAGLHEKQLLMDVIKDNTSAITSLKTSLDLNNSSVIELLQNIGRDVYTTTVNTMTVMTNQNNTIKQIDKNIKQNETTNRYIEDSRSALARLNSIESHIEEVDDKLNTLSSQQVTIGKSIDRIETVVVGIQSKQSH